LTAAAVHSWLPANPLALDCRSHGAVQANAPPFHYGARLAPLPRHET
jgi:hypothetical protein